MAGIPGCVQILIEYFKHVSFDDKNFDPEGNRVANFEFQRKT